MWRNCSNDWEQRKNYLIRSLFEDIPPLVMSPVPQESRYDASSAADRSCSPLPPLIIERMPNPHDHSEEFYIDLERKMKKLYKKLFLDGARSNSVEDLMESYGENFDVQNKDSKDVQHDRVESDAFVDLPEDTAHDKVMRWHTTCTQSSTEEDPLGGDSQEDENVERASDITRTRAPTEININRSRSQLIETSKQSSCAVVTTQGPIDVHAESDLYPNSTVDDETSVLSSLRSTESENPDSNQEGITRNSTSKEDLSIPSNATNKSVELMRRQRPASAPLGSLPKDFMNANSLELSPSYTEKMSKEKSEHKSNETKKSNGLDLNELITFSTPSLNHERQENFSREATKRRKSISPVFDIKRTRSANTEIQTQTCSENTVTWNLLQNNIFVGSPKIFKLCSCNNHICK